MQPGAIAQHPTNSLAWQLIKVWKCWTGTNEISTVGVSSTVYIGMYARQQLFPAV